MGFFPGEIGLENTLTQEADVVQVLRSRGPKEKRQEFWRGFASESALLARQPSRRTSFHSVQHRVPLISDATDTRAGVKGDR